MIEFLPSLNALLNATATVLLVTGFLLIRRQRVTAHHRVMIGAFCVSFLFLVSYLYYHYHHGVTRYTGTGWLRFTYFAILGTHTVLAVVVVPLVLMTLFQALRGKFPRHKAWARWTLPLWLYVSVTGVIVYVMLYHLR
jgi:uncharacterized membrane protein YozB (DUF420 family)